MLKSKFLGVVLQSRFEFTPITLLAILSSYILSGTYDLVQLFWTSTSYLFLHMFVASVNNTYDVASDEVSIIRKSANPLVNNKLSILGAQVMNVLSALLALLTSLFSGTYWVILTLVGIALVILYDLQPFRFKDRIIGLLIVPLGYAALPFLFSYINIKHNIVLSPLFFIVLFFFYINGISSIRHIPDIKTDREMQVRNFTSVYGPKATKVLEVCITLILLFSMILAIALGYISILGLPILVIVTIYKLRVLLKPYSILSNPSIWKNFGKILIINNVSMTIGLLGNVL